MRKNRLVRNIALLSIIIAMLPAAYAQSGTGSWFFVAVNALIVGVVLFILQAFLIPKKEPKEQTVAWVAIIAASLVVAFFFGRNVFLWQGPLGKFLNVYVIVNTLIIAIAGYFILGLLKIGNITSPEGKAGYGILIFLGALVWAIGIQNSYGNVFIWQAYQYFISYFIGPEGILNPYPPQYRLLVFAGSAVLLAFFFSNYLITGTGANNKVNYGLALILAMNMASSGVSVRSVIILGEIVFTLVLQKALAAGPASNKWASWLLAAGLVGWASAAMTFGTEYQGALATPIGWIMSWFGLVDAGTGTGGRWGYSGIVVLAIILIVGIILWSIFRREGMLREGAKRVWKHALDQMRKIKGLGKFITDTLGQKNPVLDRELPFELKDMRYEIYMLWNWILRHEIFKAKTEGTRKMVKEMKEIESFFGDKSPTPQDIHMNIKGWIEGGEVSFGEVTMPDGTKRIEWKQKGGKHGWGRGYLIIYELMSRLEKLLNNDLTIPLDARLITEATRTFGERLGAHKKAMETAYEKYGTGVRRYKAVNKIRASYLRFLDMLNLYGKHQRGYLFARLNAKPEFYTYEIKKGSDNKLHRKIDWATVKKIDNPGVVPDEKNYEEGTNNKYLLELNLFGFSTSDINSIELEYKDGYKGKKLIRRFIFKDRLYLPRPVRDWSMEDEINSREDITDAQKAELIKNVDILSEAQPNVVFSEILTLSVTEWEFFVRDMFRGAFHPYSRTLEDYDHLLSDVEVVLDNAHFRGLLDQDKDIAFDREGLKNPGLFVYWGRNKYYDPTPDSLKKFPANPYPQASIAGMWGFIKSYSVRFAGDLHTTETYLEEYFKAQYGDLGKTTAETKGEKRNE